MSVFFLIVDYKINPDIKLLATVILSADAF